MRWGETLSDEFLVKNGVRQGAVLSPSLFSLYIDSLLTKLQSSGYGCFVNNHFYGCSAYADDIVLLSPSTNALQSMFDICVKYFEEHKITISTNVIIEKSKTKCIYFSHTRSKIEPAKIMFNDVPLPWVDSWPHLGNELNQKDMIIKAGSSMDADLDSKRRKFIGKYHSLRQEFGFSSPDVLFKLCLLYTSPSPRDS